MKMRRISSTIQVLVLMLSTAVTEPRSEDTTSKDSSILGRRLSSLEPSTETTMERVLNSLRADGIRVHFEEIPRDPVADAIRTTDGLIRGWRVPTFSLSPQEISTPTVRAVLDALCSKDPRYRYRVVGSEENAAIVFEPTEECTAPCLTRNILLETEDRLASDTVHNILFSPTGPGLVRGHLTCGTIVQDQGKFLHVETSLRIENGWTLQRFLTELAISMGENWCWQVWGTHDNRQLLFGRCEKVRVVIFKARDENPVSE